MSEVPETDPLVFLDVTNPDDWPDEEPEDYLIHGLLSSSLTCLAADPGAGKTYLALGMALALLNGDDEFLGCKVTRRLRRVLVITSDANGPTSIRRRVVGLINEPRECKLLVVGFPPMGIDWDALTQSMEEHDIQLVIVDNLLGVCEDANELSEAKRITRAFLDWHERLGVATLMLTHTAKPGLNGPPQGVNAAYGTRFWTVPARVKSSLTYNEREQRRTLKAINNDAAFLKIEGRLDVVESRGFWSIWKQEKVEREPEPETAWPDMLADRIVEEQPNETALTPLASLYADEVGRKPETVRQALRSLIEYVDGDWRRKAA